jgi:hypothetical protein
VRLTHGEWLDHDGDVTQEHLIARSIALDVELPFQTDVVTSAGVEKAVDMDKTGDRHYDCGCWMTP